jgi:CyaY protein
MMDESRYLQLADKTFRTISDAFEHVDPDDVDVYTAGDVLTLAFRDGSKCVINTQRPTRQIWLAANARAWHFNYDEATATWIDDKGRGDELLARVTAIVKENSGVEVKISG